MDTELTENEAATLEGGAEIAAALAAESAPEHDHYSLGEMLALADERRLASGQWSMPEHLAVCPLCLEIFEMVLDGVPEPGAAALERFMSVVTRANAGSQARFRRFSARTTLLRLAAGILIALLAYGAYHYQTTRNPPVIGAGVLLAREGRPLTPGQTLPANTQVIAGENTDAVLDDGSRVVIFKDSRVKFQRNRHGAPVFTLAQGSLLADVAPQAPGRELAVKTDLGSVHVVGTRFRVERSVETVKVHESGANPVSSYTEEIAVMRVTVLEGTVLVRNRRERATAWSGSTAVVRSNHPHIEVQ